MTKEYRDRELAAAVIEAGKALEYYKAVQFKAGRGSNQIRREADDRLTFWRNKVSYLEVAEPEVEGEFPEVLTDTEHGGEASTEAHRENCHQCALEYALWQKD